MLRLIARSKARDISNNAKQFTNYEFDTLNLELRFPGRFEPFERLERLERFSVPLKPP
jgi:hypothetical protein